MSAEMARNIALTVASLLGSNMGEKRNLIHAGFSSEKLLLRWLMVG